MKAHRIIFVTGLTLLCGLHTLAAEEKQECYQQSTGDRTKCKYKCNCAIGSDRCTGQCRTGYCYQGYDGPACQRKNVALHLASVAKFSMVGIIGSSETFAVDSDIRQDWTPGTRPVCSVAKPANWYAWWQVQFNSYHAVYWMDVYYRTGFNCQAYPSFGVNDTKCTSQNRNLQIWTGNYSLASAPGNQSSMFESNLLCHAHDGKSPIPDRDSITCSMPIIGNAVVFLLPVTGQDTPKLSLCEVKIYECDDYWFGRQCDFNCMCRDSGEVCDKVTGHCRSGCKAGSMGAGCLHGCPNRKYGPDCVQDCHCKTNANCDKVSGHCKAGCARGWYGDSCEKQCADGKFGDYCQDNCHCLNGHDKCDKVSGACDDSKCSAGWRGSTCQIPCTAGTHGANCGLSCNCENHGECDRFTGSCPNGCALGFTGTDCLMVCTNGTFGSDCKGACHCTDASKCEKKNGECMGGVGCVTGYNGTNCQTLDTSKCDKKNGECMGGVGCVIGYNGTNCQTLVAPEPPAPTPFPVIPVAVGVGGFVILVVLVVSIILIVRRFAPEPPAPTPFPVIPVAAGVGGFVFLVVLVVIIILIVRRCSRYKMDSKLDYQNSIVMKQSKAFSKEASVIIDEDMVASSVHTDPAHYYSIVEEEDEVDEGVYVNPGETLSGETEIAVSEMWAEVHRRTDDNSLITEYKALPVGLLEKHNHADKPGVAEKCRFKGIIPYDKNRVILTPHKDILYSDFINSSYIDGFNKPKAYVAAEGPIETTRDDFWRMIWQLETNKIVMLTNLLEKGKRKCDKYWPDSSAMLCGDIMVEHVKTVKYPAYVVRTLGVKKQGEKLPRCVKHYHYRNWPDKGVPSETTTLAVFREKVHEDLSGPKGPIVVHCSSGIGRSGSFLAFDIQMERARSEKSVDIYQCVHSLRHQRLNMVPTSEKYMYLYAILTDSVLCDGSTIANEDYLRLYPNLVEVDGSSKSKVQREYKVLQSLKPKAAQPYEAATSPENVDKNRSKEIFAADTSRVVLVSAVPGTTDYINAVFVPTFLSERSLIATQIPLAETTIDFWRMVYEQKCRCVVMISRSRDEESRSYWPPQGETTKISSFKVTTENYLPSEQFDIRNMRVWYKPSGDANGLAVRNFTFGNWDSRTNLNQDILSLGDANGLAVRNFTFGNWDSRTNLNQDILSLVSAVRDWCKHSESGPIIVMCSDGTEKCGIFCSVLSLVERLSVEKNVNVMVTVKQIREARRQFINEEQYRTLYDVMRTYFSSTRQEHDMLY